VFTIDRNRRSPSTGTSVHDRLELVFTIRRNAQLNGRWALCCRRGCRQRRCRRRDRLRGCGGPAFRGACRLSRAAAPTTACPTGSSPRPSSRRPRRCARSGHRIGDSVFKVMEGSYEDHRTIDQPCASASSPPPPCREIAARMDRQPGSQPPLGPRRPHRAGSP
jgi:hypothetical protein